VQRLTLYIFICKDFEDNIKDKDTIKMLIPQLRDHDIFNNDDERCKTYPLNQKKNIPSPEGSFLREIKDIGIHRKALYGLPCLHKQFNNDTCKRSCISRGGKKNKTKHKKNKTKHKKNKTKNRHFK
jgi:hypothetical protein